MSCRKGMKQDEWGRGKHHRTGRRREQLNGKSRGNYGATEKNGNFHENPSASEDRRAGNPARTGGIRKRVTVCGRKNVWPGMNDEWKSRNGYCGKFRHWPCMREQ